MCQQSKMLLNNSASVWFKKSCLKKLQQQQQNPKFQHMRLVKNKQK